MNTLLVRQSINRRYGDTKAFLVAAGLSNRRLKKMMYTGRPLDDETMERIADVLGLRVEDLFDV